MSDGLISPAVGLTMWAVSSLATGFSISKLKNEIDEKKVPLMGVLGAFVFAAQMINFSIPATGSSGHLVGGILLSTILGPYAAFLTIVSILIIQALFFADGGLLALCCNIFNMGFLATFVAYPLIFKLITKNKINQFRLFSATLLSSIVGLQFGAFSVVIETLLSGKTDLPFFTFVMLMQPIHFLIGIVEGLITYAVVYYIYRQESNIINLNYQPLSINKNSFNKIIIIFTILMLFIGGILSWFASSNPDGLEWSIYKTAGYKFTEIETKLHTLFKNLQDKLSILPDYNFKNITTDNTQQKNIVNLGTSLSGVLGGLITLFITIFIGTLILISKKLFFKSSSEKNK